MSEVLKGNAKTKSEAGKDMQEIMNQLYEAMDKMQENMRSVAYRLESLQISTSQEKVPEFGPAVPPTGHMGPPPMAPITPMTPVSPAPTMSMPSGILPPPPAVPPSVPPMVPTRNVVPTQPTLPVVSFAGFSPAKIGEQPMTHAAQIEMTGLKNPPCQVIEEGTGIIRFVSPTSRHDPATGTAAFAPLGYVLIKNTNEYRRVYP